MLSFPRIGLPPNHPNFNRIFPNNPAMLRFPRIGLPPNHPNFNRIFPNNPAIGLSPFMMTQAHAQIAGACHGTSNRSGNPEDSQTFFQTCPRYTMYNIVYACILFSDIILYISDMPKYMIPSMFFFACVYVYMYIHIHT